MEALALLFVIFIFVWLLQPPPKSKPPKAGDKLMDGLKAAAIEIHGELMKPDKSGSSASSSSSTNVIVLAILFGFIVTLLLS